MNSNLSVVNHSLTMSSREIAALCGKEHDNVRREAAAIEIIDAVEA